MSLASRSKSLEYAAIAVGLLAIIASAYFIFMTDGDAFRMTNWVISLAFVVFVAYNFVNVRNLKGAISDLVEKNDRLKGDLDDTQAKLTQAQGDVETLKSDLLTAQKEIERKKQRISDLESRLDHE